MRFTKRHKCLLTIGHTIEVWRSKKVVATYTLWGKVVSKRKNCRIPNYVVEDVRTIGIPILREIGLHKKVQKDVLTWFPHLFFNYNYTAHYMGYTFHIEYVERSMGYGGKWTHAHYKLYVTFNGKKDHITGGQNYRQALMKAAENYLIKHNIL